MKGVKHLPRGAGADLQGAHSRQNFQAGCIIISNRQRENALLKKSTSERYPADEA